MKLPAGYTRRLSVASLSDGAFRLHLAALDFCGEQRSNGRLTKTGVTLLPRLPRSWRALAIELVGAGLWVQTSDDAWELIDAERHDPELLAKRAEAGRKGGLARSKHDPPLPSIEPSKLPSKVLSTEASKVAEHGGVASLSPTPPLPDSTGLDLSDSESSPALSSSSEPVRLRARGAQKAPKAARWRVVPAEFEPTEEHRSIARERGLNFELELAKFRDHEFDKLKSDPVRTFRNWLRNASARDFSKPPGFAQHEQTRRVLAGAPGHDDYEARRSAAEVERIRQRNALFGSVGQSLPKLREVPK